MTLDPHRLEPGAPRRWLKSALELSTRNFSLWLLFGLGATVVSALVAPGVVGFPVARRL